MSRNFGSHVFHEGGFCLHGFCLQRVRSPAPGRKFIGGQKRLPGRIRGPLQSWFHPAQSAVRATLWETRRCGNWEVFVDRVDVEI